MESHEERRNPFGYPGRKLYGNSNSRLEKQILHFVQDDNALVQDDIAFLRAGVVAFFSVL
jgi:hypothetical protein